MRVALNRKLFLLFFPLFLLSVASAAVVIFNIHQMRLSGDDIRDIKDFEIAVRHIETFNWGPQARMPSEQWSHFLGCAEDLSAKTALLRHISGDLPDPVKERLALLDEQTAYYKEAFADLLTRQQADHAMHEKAHEIIERLSIALSRRGGGGDSFSQIFYYWGQAYHDRDLGAIDGLRELTGDVNLFPPGGADRTLAAELMRLTDENYLNQLGILERENFLDGAGKRFAELSREAVSAIRGYLERRQRVLYLELGALGLFMVFLMGAGWYATTRHVRRFLARSRDIVRSIERGDYEYGTDDGPDDEFGDLLRFLRETGDSLKASIERTHASEARYRQLVEDISAWVWETDERGLCSYSSPVVRRLLGLKPGEMEGRPMADFLCGHDEFGDCRTAFEEKRPRTGVVSGVRMADGTLVMLESSWEVMHDKDGAFMGFRGLSTDVTARVLAEEERRRLQEQLHHAQKMEAIGTLSGGVAHDFNNLLQVMGGYAEMMLRRGTLHDADRHSVERIVETIGHAGRLTRQLLLYSRRIEAEAKPLDINAEVAHAKELLERTIPKMIRIETELGEGLPPILADSVQIEQILLNLGVNARDVMPGGGTITIRTFLAEPDAEGERRVALSMRDTGPGIPKEIINRIFEPYFTTKAVGKGTGLGLAIVYGIAQSLGAMVSCESEPGKGATFTLQFPAAKPQPSTIEAAAVEAESPKTEGAPLTVLIADDEFAIRETSREALKMAGYRVLCAATGEEAIELYNSPGADISLVMLDLNMPGMGGAECLRVLKEIDPSVRVVIATGFSDAETDDATLKERSVGFLRKPFRLKDLVQTVRAILGR